MTEKQKRFADEYLKDLNGTRSYKIAYPSVKRDGTAAAAASKLLRNHKVRDYIERAMETMHSERIADAEEILRYLTSVLRGESKAEVIVVESQGAGVSAARRLTKGPDERERLKAAELLAKYHQLFVPKVELTGGTGGGIIFLQEVLDGEP